MKKTKILLGIGILAIAGFFVIAADHIDAPAVTGMTTDITDVYGFQNPAGDKLVLVANVQGMLTPANTAGAAFDETVMVEFNIDTDGDAVEDMVIQAIPRNGVMYFFGPSPVTASQTGTSSTFLTGVTPNTVDISTGANAIVANSNGMSFFAGPRDDPFYFDFGQFSNILTPGDDDGDGLEETSFNDPGVDSFANTNVLSIVIEVPKTMLGSGTSINTWVETKKRQ